MARIDDHDYRHDRERVFRVHVCTILCDITEINTKKETKMVSAYVRGENGLYKIVYGRSILGTLDHGCTIKQLMACLR